MASSGGHVPDRAALAGRIQGFGNINPPPLEEETRSTIAKRAVGRLGDLVGEEVMLTVEDFREKGAVGAVKDAVADAGDILIDGVSGLIGWIRGDPPLEEDSEKAEDATRALSNGPAGAAYGISQASPTGGINAVWVMPEEADPGALASLTAQQGGLAAQQNDPRVPKNIQPYEPPAKNVCSQAPMAPLSIPGGPVIAPYEPAPAYAAAIGVPPAGLPPFPGGHANSLAQARWGPSGYSAAVPGLPGSSCSFSSGSREATSFAKGLVERIARGEVLVGPDVAKRLVSQSNAAGTTAKQLGEIVCERCRRLYLGLDGGDPADSDVALARLLRLVEELDQQGTEFTKVAVEEIRKGASEELLSLRSSAEHKDTAEPLLRRLRIGIAGEAAPAAEMPDLLGGSPSTAAIAEPVDLLDGGTPLPLSMLDDDPSPVLGDAEPMPAKPMPSAGVSSDVAALDPFLATPSSALETSVPRGGGDLVGLALDSAVLPPVLVPTEAAVTVGRGDKPPDLNALAELSSKEKKRGNAFAFVDDEMSKELAGKQLREQPGEASKT